MSHVTNVVVLCSGADSFWMARSLTKVWRQLKREDLPPKDVSSACDINAGNKKFEASIYIGAYNFLDIQKFLELLHNELCEWTALDNMSGAEFVQILIRDEHDETFSMYAYVETASDFRLQKG